MHRIQIRLIPDIKRWGGSIAVSLLAVLILCSSSLAANLENLGQIYPIFEEDFLNVIQKKLMQMQQQGEMASLQTIFLQKAKAMVARPTPVVGITPALQSHTFYVDPSITLAEDIVDHNGHILYFHGTKINPLQTMNLNKKLLFIDGDDKKQIDWAKLIDKKFLHQDKLILIKGDVQTTTSLWKRNVYFDQAGRLCQRLGIRHVPTIVTQEGLKLRIDEIALDKEREYADISVVRH